MRLLSTKFSIKTKCLIMTVFVIILYIISSFNIFRNITTRKTEKNLSDKRNLKSVQLENIVLHLDLKGSPPKLNYLKTLLPKLQDLGVTGLLVEYEDMFPFSGRLVNVSAKNCYEENKLQEFLSLAARIGFDIIPLVQTFGHMEYALKLAEFQHLREIPMFPDSLCPSKSGSQMLVKEMLEQVITFHREVAPLKYIHVGCDEVYHINQCKNCLLRKAKNMDIYLKHIHMITNTVKNISPGTTVLVWDDMFRTIPMNHWDRIQHPDIDLVYWDYTPNIKVSHISMMKYHKTVKNIWIASAFKGADGPRATYPDMTKRFMNNLSWMNLILDYKFGGDAEVYNFKGVILTGWSRYSHMDPPSELLPVSLPSLYLNLLLIRQFKKGVDNTNYFELIDFFDNYLKDNLAANLHCSELNNMDLNFDTTHCYFDGNELNLFLKHWDIIEADILNAINDAESRLPTIDFYLKIRNINMNKLLESIDWCYQSIDEIVNIKKRMTKFLSQYYDEHFIEEYVNFKIYNTKKKLEDLLRNLKNMLLVRSWGRRPYH